MELRLWRGTLFQSTLPVWGATIGEGHMELHVRFQSTLPVWGATISSCDILVMLAFQSTLPVWGATGLFPTQQVCNMYFNPRSPCGERR